MQWLFSAGAWAFVSLAVITALYLLKRRSESVTVPSLLLWQRAQQEHQAMRPFQKLKRNKLLFLQLALAILLALALMRPAVIGGAKGETVLIFDLSASMQAVERGESRLDTAKRRALSLVDGMGENDRVTVLAAGAQVQTRLSRSGDLTRVRAAVSGLSAENGGADLEAAVSLAQAMGRDIPGLNIIVFSDTYASDAVQVARCGSGTDNVALLSVACDEAGQVFVRLANYGGDTAVTLECEADGALRDVVSVDLRADETRAVLMQADPDAQTVRVTLTTPDALAADNTRWWVRRDSQVYRAALCGENVFLEKAAALRGDIQWLRAEAGEAAALEDIDLYVFDGALPASMPDQGALLCAAPDGPVLDIQPGEAAQNAGALRAATGELARRLTDHLLLEDIALRRYTPLAGGQALLYWGQEPLAAITEQAGRRAAVLGFDLHDSNLPMKADFPILIQNLLSWLLPDTRQALADGTCGQSLTLPADSRAQKMTVILPSGQKMQAGDLLEDTAQQGVYTVEYTYADRPARSLRFALHMDNGESDVRRVGAPSAALALGGAEYAGRELTPWVLLAFLALLLVEWEVSRRVA